MPIINPYELSAVGEEAMRTDAELMGARGKKGKKAAGAAEGGAIGFLSRIREIGYSVFTIGWIKLPFAPMALPVPQFAAMLIGTTAGGFRKLGWQGTAKNLETVRTTGRMGWESIHNAISGDEAVTLGEAYRLPGAVLREASAIAGGKATMMGKEVSASHMARYEASLASRANAVDARMEQLAGSMRERTAPARGAIGKAIDRFGESSLGKLINDKTAGLMQWRHGRAVAKDATHMENALAAFSQKPRSLLQKMTFRKPVSAEMHAGLGEVLGHVQSAQGLTGAARTEALESAAAALKAVKAAKGAPEGMISHVEGHIARATRSSGKVGSLTEAMEGGVSNWIRGAGKSVSGASIFTAAIATAVVAATGVAFLTARKNNHEASEQLQDFKNDVGDSNSQMLHELQSENKKHAVGRHAGAVMSSAGEALMIPCHSGADIGKLIPAQMALMSMGGLFEGNNEAVSAHALLKKAEAGELELPDQDRLEATKKLVAAVPEVKAQGGMYNMLTTPVAEAIIAKQMSVKDTMHLLADNHNFMELARGVKTQQEVAKQEALKTAASEGADTAEHASTTAPASAEHEVDNTHAAASNDNVLAANDNPPTLQIAADSAQHAGRVADHQRLRA